MITYNDTYDRSFKGRYRCGKSMAKRRGFDWLITIEEYSALLEPNTCHYCKNNLDPKGHGLDRKDNALGYTMDNVVICCGECNAIKGSKLEYDEAKVAIAAVHGLRESKNNA